MALFFDYYTSRKQILKEIEDRTYRMGLESSPVKVEISNDIKSLKIRADVIITDVNRHYKRVKYVKAVRKYRNHAYVPYGGMM
jgi:hypothetical protein